MRRTCAAVIACGLAGLAPGYAQPSAPQQQVVTPKGWSRDEAREAQLAAVLHKAPRPHQTAAAILVFRPPTPGVVLYVTGIELAGPAEQRNAIATAELEELGAAMRRHGGSPTIEASAQETAPGGTQLAASLRWRDPAAGIIDHSRTVVVADAKHVVAVTGQCVFAIDAPAELAASCVEMLATLQTSIPEAARVPLAIVATAAQPAAPAAAPPAATGEKPKSGDAPALGDGSRIALPPRVVQPAQSAPKEDRRMIYLGFGLVAIALVFWWNRRRRERFEAEDRGEARRDDDAEDLHAAAQPSPPDDMETNDQQQDGKEKDV